MAAEAPANRWPEEWREKVLNDWQPGDPRSRLSDALRPEYVINDIPIKFTDEGLAFRTWLSLAPRPAFQCFELVRHREDDIYHRLCIAFEGVNSADLWVERAQELTRRLRSSFVNDARPHGFTDATVHYLHFAPIRTGYLVVDQLFVAGLSTIKCLGKWIHAGVFASGERLPATVVEYVDEAQVLYGNVGRLPLVNSAGVTHAGSFRLDDGSIVPLRDGLPRVDNARVQVQSASPRGFTVLDCSHFRQQFWHEDFRRFANRILNERRAAPGAVASYNDARDQYLARLQSTQTTRIELQDCGTAWSADNTSLHAKIRRDIDEDDGAYLFVAARATLNSLFALNPGDRQLYVKCRDPNNRTIVTTRQCAASFFAQHRMFCSIPFPDDTYIEKVLRDQIPGAKPTAKKPGPTDFDFYTWYLIFGIRFESGVTFYPLRWEETRLNTCPDYINEFRGFRAHELIRTALQREQASVGFGDPGRGLVHPVMDTNLRFLLLHLGYMLGEDLTDKDLVSLFDHETGLQLATGQFLAWLSNLAFDTRRKKPRFYIFQSCPGAGKSLTINAIGSRLLDTAHFTTYTDVDRLMDQFNGHAGLNVLTLLEEADLNDLKGKGLRKLQEIITCEYRYERRLFKEGSMIKDYRYFILCTNVKRPIALPPGQRRAILSRFLARMAVELENDAFRQRYHDRLAKVLSDDKCWAQMAYLLHTVYDSPPARLAWETAAYSARSFNHATLQLQLESLSSDPDTSVLGWLYKHLVNHDDLIDGEGLSRYVILPENELPYPADPRKDLKDWVDLQQTLASVDYGRTAPLGFTGRWRDLPPGDYSALSYKERCELRRRTTGIWWCRAPMLVFYESYKKATAPHPLLSTAEFREACKEVFQSLNPEFFQAGDNSREIFMYETTERKAGRITEEIWCLAPLPALERMFKAALPNTGNLDWDSFRKAREDGRIRPGSINAARPKNSIIIRRQPVAVQQ